MKLPTKKSRISHQKPGSSIKPLKFCIFNFSFKRFRFNISICDLSDLVLYFNLRRVYSSVGRMFVLSSLPNVHDELVTKQSKCDEMLKSLDDKKEFLLKCSKEQEASLRELVQQRKEAAANWTTTTSFRDFWTSFNFFVYFIHILHLMRLISFDIELKHVH